MGLLLLNGESGLNPRTLFANNEQGLWLDTSQLSTMYQDSNGVTPCTAAGDPVGLILDQSRGGLSQVGADLVTNGGFAADSDWTKGANWTIGSGVATKTGGAANNLTQTISSTAAAWYRISLDVTRSAGTLTVSLGTSGTTYAITATGSYTFFILAGSGTQTLTLAGDSSFAGTVDNVVVRSVPGNHAYQTSSGARPTLARIPSSGRRNLLTRTEEFDNAAWTKTGVGTATAPVVTANQAANPLNGEMTADLVVFNLNGGTTASDASTLSGPAPTSAEYTDSFYAKTSDGTSKAFTFVGAAGVNVPITITGDWQRFSTTGTGIGSLRLRLRGSESTADSASIYLFGLQREPGSTATNYQKVVATTDVTESGVGDLWHLVFDGSDDSLVTNAVDFTGTDEMTVIAGVRKLSDAATGKIVELSTSRSSNIGSFDLRAPDSGIGGFTYLARGDAAAAANQQVILSGASYNAPVSCVLSFTTDISADLSTGRFNGSAVATATGDMGSGNFGNYAIYIGRQAGTILPYNGHLYQLIIRGTTTPTGKLLEAERFTARKTGLSI